METGENALTKEDDEPAAAHCKLLPAPTGCLLPQMHSNRLQLTPTRYLNANQVLELQTHSKLFVSKS